jgi:hypothetical protein
MNPVFEHLKHKVRAHKGYWLRSRQPDYLQLGKDTCDNPNLIILSIITKSQNIIVYRGHRSHSTLEPKRIFSLADPDSIQSILDYIHNNVD